MPHAAGLWYEWHGPEDGEVLILSAGLGGSATYWASNLAAFAERYRVLVYDQRGTGRSEPLPSAPTTVEAMAGDVLALMRALGVGRANFVGHALGGLIGLELSLLHQVLDRLVVVNGWPRLDPHTARCFDVRLELLRKSGSEAYVRAQPIFLYPAAWSSEHSSALDEEAERQLAHFPPPETVENRIAAARAFHLWLDLTCPVLALAAADDVLVPAHCSEALADELPLGTLSVMKYGGHACNVTNAAAFNRLVLQYLGS